MTNRPSPFSLDRYLSMPATEQALLLAGQVAVASALEDPDWESIDDALDRFDFLVEQLGADGMDMADFIESLRAGTHSWRTMLAEHPLVGEEVSLRALTMELCTTSCIADDEDLRSSKAVRRLDCIFDILELSWCADDVNGVYAEAGEVLLGEAKTDWVPGAVSGAKRVAEFLSYFHPVAGIAASAALQLVPGEAEAAGAYGPEDLARLLAICALIGQDEDARASRAAEALSALTRDVDRTSRRIERLLSRDGDLNQPKVQSLLALQRYQAVAVGLLKDWSADQAGPLASHVPSALGQRLPEAKAMLGAAGVEVVSVDDVNVASPRLIMSESNWVVVRQDDLDPPRVSGAPAVLLTVKKHNE